MPLSLLTMFVQVYSERKTQAEKKTDMRMWSFDEENWSLNKVVDRLGSRKTVAVVKRTSSIKDKCPALHWDNAKSALRKRPYPTKDLIWSNIKIHLEWESLNWDCCWRSSCQKTTNCLGSVSHLDLLLATFFSWELNLPVSSMWHCFYRHDRGKNKKDKHCVAGLDSLSFIRKPTEATVQSYEGEVKVQYRPRILELQVLWEVH